MAFCFGFFIAGLTSCNYLRPEKPNVVMILADDRGWQDYRPILETLSKI
jgi:hypothetical protein